MQTIFLNLVFDFTLSVTDCSEPVHVHITDNSKKICKFWLKADKIIFADNSGFTKRELIKLQREVEQNFNLIISTFNEFCKGYKK